MIEDDAVIYAFILLGIELLESIYGTKPVYDFYMDSVKIKELEDKKRTGILRAILLQNQPYTFTHTGTNSKLNRQYVSSVMDVNEDEYIYLIALDADVLNDEDHLEYINQAIPEKFEKEMHSAFERVYNGGNRSE